MVRRYDIAPFSEYADNEIFIMQESKAGDYVEYEDYQALQAKLEAIQEKLEEFCWLIGTTEEMREMRALVLDTEPSSVLLKAKVKVVNDFTIYICDRTFKEAVSKSGVINLASEYTTLLRQGGGK